MLGGVVASWLVGSTPDQVVRVRTLAVDIALCSQARHCYGASLHTGVQMGTGELYAGGNPAID